MLENIFKKIPVKKKMSVFLLSNTNIIFRIKYNLPLILTKKCKTH